MSTGIVEACTRIAELIVASTPDVEPLITYREAQYTEPIEDLPPTALYGETTRHFHVLPGPTLEPGQFTGHDLGVFQQVTVELRYDSLPTRDGYGRVIRAARSDEARIRLSLGRPPIATAWAGTTVSHADWLESELLPSARQTGVWVLRLHFRVLYLLAA